MIKAAGVLLWREANPLKLEIALIHRPKYDDWTFPKGTVNGEETVIQAAYRECHEETGIRPIFGPYLGQVDYRADGEKKRVHYWMARPENIDSHFIPNAEVDNLVWISVKEARHFLSYEDDRDLLRKFVKLERHGNVMIFLRHAKAIKREDWMGEDSDRPLSNVGQSQSIRIGNNLKAYAIAEIHTSDAIRCNDTALAVAEKLRLGSNSTEQLSEYLYERDDNAAIHYVQQLLKFGKNYLICSHNPIFDDMLNAFENGREYARHLERLSPADSWVIHHLGNRIIAIDSIPAPVVEKIN